MAKTSTLSAYARLFRIEHALLLALAVLLSEFLAGDAFGIALPALHIILLSLLVPIFIEMGSFALNDYFDVESDKANKRSDRPIASGEISPSFALIAAAAAYLLGIVCALPLPAYALYISIIFAALSLAYNFKLKELPLVGNVYIAASMAIPFLFGNLVITQSMHIPSLLIGLVVFASGLGREIIKTTEDMEGDVKHRKAKTLPVLIGKKNACYFASACYFALVPLSILPFAFGLRINMLSVSLVLLSAFSFVALGISVAKSQGKENLESSRKASLFALAIGFVGYAASLI